MSDFDGRMAALRRQFLERTRLDLALFLAATKLGDAAEIRSISHRIAGIAGVFGYAELGRKARSVEDALDRGAPVPEMNQLYAAVVDAIGSCLTEIS